MDPYPILPSAIDLERRRLESTIDQDLHSLSLSSLQTTSASQPSHSQSLSTISSLEFPRGFGEGDTNRSLSLVHPSHRHGPHGTPRAAHRKASQMSAISEVESPVSTAGHHVSAMTLGEGVFRNRRMEDESGDEFDPERSLGRLVGELGKVMGGKIAPRPTSPFAALSPPRSPSPFSSIQNHSNHNLSFSLNRNDPLPSPPTSRSASGSSSHSAGKSKTGNSRFSSMARELGQEIKTRKVLGESTAHNARYATTPGPAHKKPERTRLGALQGDVTGMTGLMETPAKGGDFGSIGKNGDVGGEAGANIAPTLASLHARLRALETENSLSRRRVRELEGELERAKGEVDVAKRHGDGRLREAIGEKTALEDLLKSLRSHLSRLTVELEQNKAIVSELRMAQSQPAHLSPPRGNTSVRDELVSLRREVERLGTEVHRLGGIVEQGLDTRRRARGEQTMMEEIPPRQATIEKDDVERIKRDMEKRSRQPPPTPGPSKLRQGLHASAVNQPSLMPPTVDPPRTRRNPNPTPPASDNEGVASPTPASSNGTKKTKRRDMAARVDGPSSPFPSIRAEDEEDFFSMLGETETPAKATRSGKPKSRLEALKEGEIPPQTVLTRVIGELEADFSHYKAIYAELADQYKILDAASAAAKRKVLAEHLKEVIDTLEQKADQIASLYELLSFDDKQNQRPSLGKTAHKSVPDILRLVRESLGEEGVKRLAEDGVGVKVKRRHKVV